MFRLVLVLLACVVCSTSDDVTSSKDVEVVVDANWKSTPLVNEIAEFLWKENPEFFWQYITDWKGGSSENCLTQLHQRASRFLSISRRQFLAVSLAFRIYSPRVELRRQIAELSTGYKKSCCWAEIQWTPTEVKTFIRSTDLAAFLHQEQSWKIVPETFSFDFKFQKNQNGPVIVLYGGIGTKCFQNFHQILTQADQKFSFQYIFRPVFDLDLCYKETLDSCVGYGEGQEIHLSGFGVELALKNTEYIAVDEKETLEENQDSEPQEEDSASTIKEKEDSASTIKEKEESVEELRLKSIGFQASQRILKSDDPLSTMTHLVQNFPTMISSLSKKKVKKDFKEKFKSVSKRLPTSRSFILLNGLPFEFEDFDMFQFLDRLDSEIIARQKLNELDLPLEVVSELLRLRKEDQSEELEDVRYDTLPSEELVVYLNDVEKDPEYDSYYRSLEILFNPYIGNGPLVPIRRNLFTAVFFVELDSEAGLELAQVVQKLYEIPAAIRFGVVPLLPEEKTTDNSATSKLTLLFLVLHFSVGPQAAFHFWASYDSKPSNLEKQFVHSWEKFAQKKNKGTSQETLKLFHKKEGVYLEAIEYLNNVRSSLEATGMSLLNSKGSLWLNGHLLKLDLTTIERQLLFFVGMELKVIQRLFYIGAIKNSDKILLKKILENENSFEKYAPHILSESTPFQELTLSSEDVEKFIYWHQDEAKPTVTHWIVGKLESKNGLIFLKSAVTFLNSFLGDRSQFAFHFSDHCSCLAQIWNVTTIPQQSNPLPGVLSFWTELFSDTTSSNKLLECPDGDKEDFIKQISTLFEKHKIPVEDLKEYLTASCKMDASEKPPFQDLDLSKGIYLITNGRVLFFSSESEVKFSVDDFVMLQTIAEDFQMAREIRRILTPHFYAKTVSKTVPIIASILRKYNVPALNLEPAVLQELFASFDKDISLKATVQKEKKMSPVMEIEMVVDPLSSESQRIIPVLQFLRKIFQVSIQIYLNPKQETSEVPLNSFHSTALPQLQLNLDGILESWEPPLAKLQSIPHDKLLTMNPEIPETWLIEPMKAQLDLDNIKLEDLGSKKTLEVQYRLESILLTGSCLDRTASTRKDAYPRGVQLTLGKSETYHDVDTLVMSNLGYFQLKGSPGIWFLKLAKGRSQELYSIDPRMKTDETLELKQNKETSSLKLVLDSFQGRHLRLRIMKKPGYESEDVLDIKDQSSGFLQGFKNWLGPDEGKDDREKEMEDNWKDCNHRENPVHVFTIASGHMYERLQKIMILSVLKNTNSCVKFWFIKNYMSPQIKEFLPYFAKEYKFNYGLITYKWPTWLQKQNEKQRIIWAYKILFLDVLFPLNVPKVIFLDSDQIIRTDIRQLYDLDIHGAPLAYTPFCDNNKAMDGFRFWKGGFWKNHLKGKPYHISALYVVDLVKFRQMAAGDHLRVVYDTLSQDPNSLSNLDQDLPNYAQHQVPIYSLNQEWLWCESWCGNATKASAKTIDLCNNPMTKEPKLQAARRIVSEWVDLDAEVRKVTQTYEKPTIQESSKSLHHDGTEL